MMQLIYQSRIDEFISNVISIFFFPSKMLQVYVNAGELYQEGKKQRKSLLANSNEGITELKNEIALLAKLQHRNLVKLLVLGCFLEDREKLLVHEFVQNNSCNHFLFGQSSNFIIVLSIVYPDYIQFITILCMDIIRLIMSRLSYVDPVRGVELNNWELRYKIIGGVSSIWVAYLMMIIINLNTKYNKYELFSKQKYTTCILFYKVGYLKFPSHLYLFYLTKRSLIVKAM